MTMRKTDIFKKWLKKLRDNTGKGLILARIDRLEAGNPGDVKPIGDGCSEMRINYGPGYRVYYKDTGKEIIILLCGGDKSSQDADIARAKQIALLPLEEENEEE
jgi:putative addiction module killer protein